MFNSKALNNEDGLSLHRVVVLGVNKDSITFHDPRKEKNLPPRIENKESFEKTWLGIDEPELCVYFKFL